MKILIYILIVLAAGLVLFNLTKLDFNHLLEGDSAIAAIGVLASLCAILAMGVLLISKKIASKNKK